MINPTRHTLGLCLDGYKVGRHITQERNKPTQNVAIHKGGTGKGKIIDEYTNINYQIQKCAKTLFEDHKQEDNTTRKPSETQKTLF